MSKFKVGDKVVKADGEKWTSGEKYKFITKINFWREEYLLSNSIGWWDEKELKLYEGVKEMKELTFREVIADIKEGEIWGNGAKIIELINGTIQVRSKNNIPFNSCFINFSKVAKYKLQRKEYTFEEAFKAYEEGKEIESCYTATKFCENEYLENNVYSDWKLGVRFKVDEIKGKWYINEVD